MTVNKRTWKNVEEYFPVLISIIIPKFESENDSKQKNLKECGRMFSCPHFNHYPANYLQNRNKTKDSFSQNSQYPDLYLNPAIPTINPLYKPLDSDIRYITL